MCVCEVIRTANVNIAVFCYVTPCSLVLILKNWKSVWTGFSLKLKEDPRLRVAEGGVLKRLVWSKWYNVRGEWRKLRTVEHNDM
jgi:hypothetical protein